MSFPRRDGTAVRYLPGTLFLIGVLGGLTTFDPVFNASQVPIFLVGTLFSLAVGVYIGLSDKDVSLLVASFTSLGLGYLAYLFIVSPFRALAPVGKVVIAVELLVFIVSGPAVLTYVTGHLLRDLVLGRSRTYSRSSLFLVGAIGLVLSLAVLYLILETPVAV